MRGWLYRGTVRSPWHALLVGLPELAGHSKGGGRAVEEQGTFIADVLDHIGPVPGRVVVGAWDYLSWLPGVASPSSPVCRASASWDGPDCPRDVP